MGEIIAWVIGSAIGRVLGFVLGCTLVIYLGIEYLPYTLIFLIFLYFFNKFLGWASEKYYDWKLERWIEKEAKKDAKKREKEKKQEEKRLAKEKKQEEKRLAKEAMKKQKEEEIN